MSGKAPDHWSDRRNEMSEAAAQYFAASDLSQPRLVAFVLSLLPVQSAADFGCGRGTWLKALIDCGVTDVRGYDLPGTPPAELRFPPDLLVTVDLGAPLDPGRRFDLCISTEVAEHLPATQAPTFIANLCAASDCVLFSAALPYQGGAGHVNEMWVEYWAKLFAAKGYDCFDLIRPAFWHDGSVRSYYRQNCLLFVTGATADALVAAGHSLTVNPLSLVHPEQYLKAVNRPLPPDRARLAADVRQFYDTVTKPPSQVDAGPDRHSYGRDRIGWGAISAALRRD